MIVFVTGQEQGRVLLAESICSILICAGFSDGGEELS